MRCSDPMDGDISGDNDSGTWTGRRPVLQALGGVGASTVGFSTVSEAAVGGSNRYIGYTYDPAYFNIYAKSEAKVTETPSELRGRIQIQNVPGIVKKGGQPTRNVTIPLSPQNPTVAEAPSGHPNSRIFHELEIKEFGKSDKDSSGPGGAPLIVNIHSAQNLTGAIGYPDNPQHIGFALANVADHNSEQEALQRIKTTLKQRQQSLSYGGER